MARFEAPEGTIVQAFQFTLDLTGNQASMVRRQFGGRRYAYNWAVRTMKADGQLGGRRAQKSSWPFGPSGTNSWAVT
jgi:hypothetical protein